MAMRPYWSGHIRMSLVSFPVNIYAALSNARQIPLHEIYRPTGQRVRHQNVVDGEPIERTDIVKGYEVEKGRYVILEPEEIKALKVPSKKVIDISQFVERTAIDPIYFETPYYVAPDGKSGENAFVVIRDALRATGKIGLGQLAIGGRERLCAIEPSGKGMMLETLRYEEEIRKSDPYFGDIEEQSEDREELELAKELIKRKSASFKPEQFHDHYREALQELIDAKHEHRAPREVVEEKTAGKVINLMDALRKSLNVKKTERAKKPRAKTKTKSASRSRKAG